MELLSKVYENIRTSAPYRVATGALMCSKIFFITLNLAFSPYWKLYGISSLRAKERLSEYQLS